MTKKILLNSVIILALIPFLVLNLSEFFLFIGECKYATTGIISAVESCQLKNFEETFKKFDDFAVIIILILVFYSPISLPIYLGIFVLAVFNFIKDFKEIKNKKESKKEVFSKASFYLLFLFIFLPTLFIFVLVLKNILN